MQSFLFSIFACLAIGINYADFKTTVMQLVALGAIAIATDLHFKPSYSLALSCGVLILVWPWYGGLGVWLLCCAINKGTKGQ